MKTSINETEQTQTIKEVSYKEPPEYFNDDMRKAATSWENQKAKEESEEKPSIK